MMFISCKKSSDTNPASPYSSPVVTTSSVTNITSTSAVSGGTIVSEGGTPVTARGVCWATSPNVPYLNCFQNVEPGYNFTYASTMTALLPHTTYYVRAWAANGQNYYGFGQEIMFTTQ
ncbi:MAG: hypothetical protein JST86_00150 [Bacteroidetes bacterium]|nr:hypothetical protein [Bacteroidota bacterium]